jgi:hypothetical protein
MATSTVWQVEEYATAALLEIRLNELREAGTGVLFLLGNATDGYTIAFLE